MIDIKYAGLNFSDEELKAIEECEYEIQDINKFLEFLKLDKYAKKLQFITVSDGRKIDLFKPKASVVAETLDLSDTEQEKVLTKQVNFRKLNTKALNIRRVAFGGYGNEKVRMKKSILSDRKSEILEYFGRMFSIREVLVILKNDTNSKNITEITLTDFYRENLDEVKRLQQKHKDDYSHLRLTAKTSRLEELTWLYGKLKRKYETSSNREDHKALLQTMESIRKEVEGDKLTLQGNIGVQVQHEVNLHVRSELMKGVALKEVILSRLASRSGINPLKILNSLNDSYYAKWNRLLNDTVETDFEEITFPSLQSYDFDKIKVVNENREKQEKIDTEQEKIAKFQTEIPEKDKIKESLLERLRQSANNQTTQQNQINKKFI